LGEKTLSRDPIPTWCFALAVVRRDDEFLLVREREHGRLWYLPAGRVEPGESFIRAAERETLEESGVRVQVDGIVRVEHSPRAANARMRIIFTAHPTGDSTPKSEPDEESLEATWVTIDELDDYRLRGDEVRRILHYVAGGGVVYPLTLLQPEGMPFLL